MARVSGVESCGLHINRFRAAWFSFSLFAAISPWCVSSFFFVSSQLVVSGLNWLHGVGHGARNPPVYHRPPSKVQAKALSVLAGEVSQFLPSVRVKGGGSGPGAKAAGSHHRPRRGGSLHCGTIGLGKDLCSTHGLCSRSPSGSEPRAEDQRSGRRTHPRSNGRGFRCGLAGACGWTREHGHLRTYRVQRNSRGSLMRVAKAGNNRNTGPQRLIMNIKVSNWAQHVISGDMPQLPTGGVWS